MEIMENGEFTPYYKGCVYQVELIKYSHKTMGKPLSRMMVDLLESNILDLLEASSEPNEKSKCQGRLYAMGRYRKVHNIEPEKSPESLSSSHSK